MLDLGFQELIIIFAVAIIVFGPKKLPELSRNLGKGIGHLKKALFDVKYEINKEIRIMDEDSGLSPVDDEPKWKKEALDAIYGGKGPDVGGVQGPGGASGEGESTDRVDGAGPEKGQGGGKEDRTGGGETN